MQKINFTLIFIFLFLSSFSQQKISKKYFSMPVGITADDYLENTIVAKVKPEYRDACFTDKIAIEKLNTLLQNLNVTLVKKKFPNHKAPERMYNERGEKLADLSLIYQIEFVSGNATLEKIINQLYALHIFEFAEPAYIPHLDYTPSDSYISSQWHLTTVSAFTAWDVNKGDTNVVIGITDTGTEPTHADLKSNIKHNYNDPVNGIDDDADGYLDNYSGWDLGEDDNDPTWQGDAHGVHVSGLAAASTDNAKGVAGTGFQCKFLPVKIADSNGDLTMAYEGIVYAADHGCDIINCSWGSSYGGSYGQTIIDYATINQDALVIASAGNDGVESENYPAAYTYAIAVANTSSNDKKHGSSNYGYWVDVCAPGVSLYSTYSNGSYLTMTGTSMSAPCASGAAALIQSYFPTYTALQVGEQLKMSCDDISSINSSSYKEKLGRGRIDMYQSLTQTGSPSVVMTSRTITDYDNEVFSTNDTLYIFGDFTNYLSPTTSSCTATLASTSSYVSLLKNSATLGVISTLGSVTNNGDPFKVKINSNAPQNTEVKFSITYADGSYKATEYFSVIVNVDYINIAINDVATTITSKGRIGYNEFGQLEGLGFSYKGGESLLYEAGLMIGTSSSKVSDGVRNDVSADEDFSSVSNVVEIAPSLLSEFDVSGDFNDVQTSSPIDIEVKHNAYAWTSSGHTKYVIVEYFIINNGSSKINSLYAGLFADWDIDATSYDKNKAEYDSGNKMGYAYYTGGGLTYAGIKLLSNTSPAIHYAIDNISGGSGGIDMYDGYDSSDKYKTLSTNRTSAGTSGNGNDICDVVSSGPFSITVGDTAVVAFALIAGDDLADLQNSAVNAQAMYDSIQPYYTVITDIENTNSLQVDFFPNPVKDQLNIIYDLQNISTIEIEMMDALGRNIKTIKFENLYIGTHQHAIDVNEFPSGIYLCKIKTTEGNSCWKWVKQ